MAYVGTVISKNMGNKMTKIGLWRSYGLGNYIVGSQLPGNRYKSNTRKSLYWWLISRYCRIRDFRKYGVCISCGTSFGNFSDGDGGHFAPAQGCGVGLLFDLFNVNLECRQCNAFDEGHIIGYRRGLIERHGVKVVEDIERRYQHHQKFPGAEKEWSQIQYDNVIKDLITLMVEEDMLELVEMEEVC